MTLHPVSQTPCQMPLVIERLERLEAECERCRRERLSADLSCRHSSTVLRVFGVGSEPRESER